MPTEEATFATGDIEAAADAVLAAGAPSVLIEVRNGDEVWRHSLGVTTVTGSERPDPLAPIRVASVTKSMIGAILLQLVSEGALDLDEPIATYLPDLRLGRPVIQRGADALDLELGPSPTPTGPGWTAPVESPQPTAVPDGAEAGTDVAFENSGAPILNPTGIITARMLAQHTAGLPDYIGTFPLADMTNLTETLESEYELESLVHRVAASPWTGTPGGHFSYSNTNYLVLSMLIEAITGESVHAVFRERIAEGGELAATSLPRGAQLPEAGAHGYFTHEGIYIDVSNQSGTLWSGAGGALSTVGDVNSFYRGLMQGAYLRPEGLAEALALNADGYGIGVQGHVDPCPPGEPVFAMAPDAPGTSATPAPTSSGRPDGDGDGDAAGGGVGVGGDSAGAPGDAGADEAPRAGGAVPAATGVTEPGGLEPDETAPGGSAPGGTGPDGTGIPGAPVATLDSSVQIGEPGMTYGHMGSGLGYRILSFSSPDGLRQVTVAWTASPLDYGADPRLEPAWQVVDAALLATCPR